MGFLFLRSVRVGTVGVEAQGGVCRNAPGSRGPDAHRLCYSIKRSTELAPIHCDINDLIMLGAW